jgi:L-alanine-DL-glutamate epimerase-like enolase superfamily enzyme
MIDHAQVGFIQIDAGRIGGITTARQVARYASERGVKYVNHTFTTDLALSASVQAYAGQETDTLCEFPFDPSALARDFTQNKMVANARGQVTIPDRPGLGVEPDLEALRKYFVPVELKVGGETVFRSLELK